MKSSPGVYNAVTRESLSTGPLQQSPTLNTENCSGEILAILLRMAPPRRRGSQCLKAGTLWWPVGYRLCRAKSQDHKTLWVRVFQLVLGAEDSSEVCSHGKVARVHSTLVRAQELKYNLAQDVI